jgi:hypothetical protein
MSSGDENAINNASSKKAKKVALRFYPLKDMDIAL